MILIIIGNYDFFYDIFLKLKFWFFIYLYVYYYILRIFMICGFIKLVVEMLNIKVKKDFNFERVFFFLC